VELAYEDGADVIADKVFALECEAFPEAINKVDQLGIEFFWKRVGL
jgi:phosphoribosylglycinamide formyltransferase-1